ncbi:phasin family protein [Asticcacaulis sp.]|uniref:phasin family protein n=1 Tax=Asticcacaulis sp. TaxID=1872648 RepID=UPI002617ECF8|nr:phasin family protein [Asticcacaulis sp.]
MDPLKTVQNAPEKTAEKTADTLSDAEQTVTSAASEALHHTQDAVKESTERGMAIGQDALNRTHAETQRLGQRGVEMGNEALKACVTAGHQTADLMSELNQAMTELGNQSISHYGRLSRQAMGVRTVQDMVNLQSAAAETLQDNMGGFARLYGLYVEGLGRIMQPIAEQAVKSQRRLSPAA